MKEEIKHLWIDALTSGAYKQGTGRLKTIHGNYCCLGVLSDLYIQETGKGSWNENCKFITTHGSTEQSVLPAEVQQWAGIDSRNTRVTIPGRTTSLAVLNDSKKSFGRIAEIIENNL